MNLERRQLLTGLASMFGCGLVTFWAVDVVVNLGLLDRFVFRSFLEENIWDYLGLFVAESQPALVVSVISVVLGTCIALIRKKRDVMREMASILFASISAVIILAGTRVMWGFRPVDMRASVMIAGLAGLILWSVHRILSGKMSSRRWGFGDFTELVCIPAILVALANRTLDLIVDGRTTVAVLNAGAIVICAGAIWMAISSSSGHWRRLARYGPLALILFMALYSAIKPSSYRDTVDATDSPGEGRPPNIVLIVLDTVRADHLKKFGYRRDTMPELEKWAAESSSFLRAISPGGWTTPSHASLFSGMPVSIHGVHYSTNKRRLKTKPVEGIDWLPAILSEDGYHCLGVTANTLALPSNDMGFARVVEPKRTGWFNDTIGALVDHVSPVMHRFNEYMRWRMPYVDAKRIVDIVIDTTPVGDYPLFLFVNFLDAHAPYNPPGSALRSLECNSPRAFGRYNSDRALTLKWESMPDSKEAYLADMYDAELRGLDGQLKILLDWVDDRLGDDTIVIVTSDHGEELGEEGRVGHAYGLAQSIIHVPLFVRAPGLPTGDVDQTVNIRRLFDFILHSSRGESTGIEDLVPTGSDEALSERYRSARNARERGPEYGRAWVSLIDGGFKGVGPSGDGFTLYDIASEGFDREVDVTDTPDEKDLQARIDEYWELSQDRRGSEAESDELDEEVLKKLRSLGYIK